MSTMDARAFDRETTTTIIEFRGYLFHWNLFSASAIIQTSMSSQSVFARPKRRTKATVKPRKHVFHNDPQPYLAALPQLPPAESTDMLQDQLSLEIQQMQEEARRSYHQRLEQKTDRESLEILEASERFKAERLVLNDRKSLALLEDATTKLRNKMTHCTPPFQPTLWQRATRVTASQSTDDKIKTLSKQVDDKRSTPLGQESSHHSIGSSYAVLSPVQNALDSPRSRHESSPSHDDRFSINAREWLEDNLVDEPAPPNTAEQKINNWLQTISSTTSDDKERADVKSPTTTSGNSSPSTQSLSSLYVEDSNSQAVPSDSGEQEEAVVASLQSFDMVSSSGNTVENTVSHEDERSHVAGLTVHEVELAMPSMRGDGSVIDEREDQQDADAEREDKEEWIDVADELKGYEEVKSP